MEILAYFEMREVELHYAPFVKIRCVRSFPKDSSMDNPSQFQGNLV